MRYFDRFAPRGALEDLFAYWRQPTPYRWQILGLSVALTFTIMVFFLPENQRVEPRPPDVTYISTFEPGRTDEQIRASNIANQKRQDERRARRAAVEERQKAAYRALGRATGLDVDAMEEQIARERAAEEAAAARPEQDSGARTASGD